MSAPPGWYSDPGGNPQWRWWDGVQWTGHVAPAVRGPARPDPAALVAGERQIARWARMALPAQALIQPTAMLLMWRFFDSFFGFAAAMEASPGEVPGYPFGFGRVVQIQLGMQLVNLVSLACLVVLAVWFFRAAQAAANLGLPARRSPGLATASWFIPGVNLWWPCESTRDLLPPGHDTRRRITWLWVVGMAAGLLTMLGLFAVMFDAILGMAASSGEAGLPRGAGIPVGFQALTIVGSLTTAGVLVAARGVVADVLAEHEVLLRSQGAPQDRA